MDAVQDLRPERRRLVDRCLETIGKLALGLEAGTLEFT